MQSPCTVTWVITHSKHWRDWFSYNLSLLNVVAFLNLNGGLANLRLFIYFPSFFVNPGSNTALQLRVQSTIAGAPNAIADVGAFPSNTWTQVTVSLQSLGVASSTIDGFWLQV